MVNLTNKEFMKLLHIATSKGSVEEMDKPLNNTLCNYRPYDLVFKKVGDGL